MAWLHHPKFVRTRDSILAALRSKQVQFRRTKPVAFVCGGWKSPRRDRLAQYLREHLDMLVFYAEDVWDVLASQPAVNALQMEEQLAKLADVVPMVVESPGTFTELGAFSLSEPLRKKLLPILDGAHQNAASFIVTGPVRWVDQDSMFGPCIWVSLPSILDAAAAIAHQLTPILKPRAALIEDVAASEKHMLFFVCDIVAIFGPCSPEDVEYYSLCLLGDAAKEKSRLMLALASALHLIRPLASGRYFRPLDGGALRSFHRTTQYITIPSLRAEAVAALLRIPEGVAALEEVALA